MSRYVLSSCHSLVLIPVACIFRFARVGSKVHLIPFGDGDRLCHIPGTLTVSSNEDDGVIVKKITMSLPDVTEEVVDSLESYGGSLLVAVYSDERGRQRVCGSPDWPLTLSYSTDGGICAITLEGRDTRPDAFFAG